MADAHRYDMESSNNNPTGKSTSPWLQPPHHHRLGTHHRPHHHHFFYISPHCPFHRPLLQPHKHSPLCSFSTYPQPGPPNENPESVASVQPETHTSFSGGVQSSEAFSYEPTWQDEIEPLEMEEEEEPIFVLTDEWRDFFAKSEAKRQLAKKQSKKKGKT